MKLAQYFIFCSVSLLALHVASQHPKKGLFASYSLNKNVKDGSGNGRNGSAVDLVSTPDRFGKSDSAYLFNGTSSYVQIANPTPSVDLNDFTVSAWYRTTSTSGYYATIISKQTATPGFIEGLGLRLFYGTTEGYLEYDSEPVTPHDTATSNDGKWHHVVFVRDRANSEARLYVDNGLRSTLFDSRPDFSSPGAIRLGATSLGYFFWDGALDDVFIYNRSLDEKGVDSLYHDKNRVLTNMNNNTIANTFKVYPNPASSLLHLDLPQFFESVTVKITNSQAQTVYSAQVSDAHSTLDISQIGSKGLYFVQLFDGAQLLSTNKLMID